MNFMLLILALLVTGSEARADIYRYSNEEGTECFTDTPTSRKAVKIMKESTLSNVNLPSGAATASCRDCVKRLCPMPLPHRGLRVRPPGEGKDLVRGGAPARSNRRHRPGPQRC